MSQRETATPGKAPRRTRTQTTGPQAQEHLLQAAGELFYEEGVRAVGVDDARDLVLLAGHHPHQRLRAQARFGLVRLETARAGAHEHHRGQADQRQIEAERDDQQDAGPASRRDGGP